MKDFISKVTFGFLMAQLLPGMVVVTVLTCMGKSADPNMNACLETMLDHIKTCWFESAFRTTTFFFLSCATGMFIHALNWMVLAWIENKGSAATQEPNPEPVIERWYHTLPLWAQLLNGPPIMVSEMLSLLGAPSLRCLRMAENVQSINHNLDWQFHFLQDFYLHFGQFYAHMAYALLLATILGVTGVFHEPSGPGFTLAVIAYFLTSIFFLFGRVQLSSLFRAEVELAEGMQNEDTSDDRRAGGTSESQSPTTHLPEEG